MLRYDGEPEKFGGFARKIHEDFVEQKLAGYLEPGIQEKTKVTMPKALYTKYRNDPVSLTAGEMKIVEMYQRQEKEHTDAGMLGIQTVYRHVSERMRHELQTIAKQASKSKLVLLKEMMTFIEQKYRRSDITSDFVIDMNLSTLTRAVEIGTDYKATMETFNELQRMKMIAKSDEEMKAMAGTQIIQWLKISPEDSPEIREMTKELEKKHQEGENWYTMQTAIDDFVRKVMSLRSIHQTKTVTVGVGISVAQEKKDSENSMVAAVMHEMVAMRKELSNNVRGRDGGRGRDYYGGRGGGGRSGGSGRSGGRGNGYDGYHQGRPDQSRQCYAYQRGECQRGNQCRFEHGKGERERSREREGKDQREVKFQERPSTPLRR